MSWSLAVVPYEETKEWIVFPIGMILMLYSILGIACTLHETIARFKLRRGHILRVVAYSSGPALTLFAVILILAQIFLVGLQPSYRTNRVANYQMGAVAFAALLFMNQFRSGLSNYLRIPHSALASFLFSIVGVLAAAAIIIFVLAIYEAIV